MAAKRITKKQVRHVAKALCHVITGGNAKEFGLCDSCDHGNCRMHAIAKDALKKARRV